ncbi:hypothetical protein [Reichenbachiella sp.]|uniref:hypothetical protein n=1 Tax=Reichenbachiella sp. TaxID=2184521 RepID=UPI003B58BBA0
MDDINYFTFSKEEGSDKWPFDQRFHLLLNIAVGGNWGGVKGVDVSVFPQEMKVDYVRVYQLISKTDKKLGTGELLMSPNPADAGRFTINSPATNIDVLKVFSMSGKQIPYNKSIHPEGVDIELSSTGEQMVVVLLESKNGTRTSNKILLD